MQRPPSLAKYVATRVSDKRRHAGLTQDELAEAVGVNRSTISRFESGETADPPISLIERVAIALGVPVRDLMPAPEPGPDRRTKHGETVPPVTHIRQINSERRSGGAVGSYAMAS